MRLSVLPITLALSVALSAAAHAQALKKYVTPDGRTLYSDRPVPGARLVGEVESPPPVDPAARAAAEKAARRDAQAAEGSAGQLKAEEARRARIEAARAELEKAERTLKEGVEPLPGERTGTAGGGSRLNDTYHARQNANQLAVEQARQQLEEARSGK